MKAPSDDRQNLGLGLKPGDPHYRAYVGPPEDYDLIAAMTFNLLTTLGLRQHHSLLDIGCGSLRIGRLLIPYLNRGKYFGVEPNKWLVEEGIKRELGEALLEIKRPTFFFSDSPETITQAKVSFDFALAQSIFSHCGLDLIKNWLSAISRSLAEHGALVATFLHAEGHVYDQDGLRSIHNHEFMDDPAFRKAYQRGVRAAGDDYRWHWRVHIGLWAAACAARLEGDFMECGVNRGFLSSAIMDYLNWDSLGKQFYLLDTFRGLDERFVSPEDKASGAGEKNTQNLATGFYVQGVEEVRANFSQWKNVSLIEGPIPETLPMVRANKIAYLHLDMNCSPPEVAAVRFFWERLSPGAPVLLDDYAFYGYVSQKIAMDRFAQEKGINILSLPTGQGLLLKPPRAC